MLRRRLVALLRGINVGRNKRIAMADLRGLLVALGHTDVLTYLQSGSAVFTTSAVISATTSPDPGLGATNPSSVAIEIEQALIQTLGVQSTVIVRTAAELTAAVAADPMRDIAHDPSKHLVGFLATRPELERGRTVAAFDVPPDAVRLVGRELYLWCPSGVLASPLSKLNWDRQLGVPVTKIRPQAPSFRAGSGRGPRLLDIAADVNSTKLAS